MTDQPTEYRIRTIADFLAIPAERRDVAISEFAGWCKVADYVAALGAPAPPDTYIWIDDDKGDLTIQAVTSDGTVVDEERFPGALKVPAE